MTAGAVIQSEISGSKVMLLDTVRQLLKKTPFEPFRLVLTDGKIYEIPHPDFMWTWGSDVWVGTREHTDDGQDYRCHYVDLFLVNRIEPLATAKSSNSPPETNGHS